MMLAACAPTANAPLPPLLPLGASVGAGEVCGGMAGLRCGTEGEFCLVPMANQCGAADGGGTCAPMPEMCAQDYAPVCGCDGRDYSNECAAHAAGVSAAHAGACGG